MRLALVIALALTGCASPPTTTATLAPPTSAASPGPTAAAGTAATRGSMSWSRVADIPTPRSEVAAALFRGVIYVVGGFGGLNAVERYDPASDRWDRLPDLPIGVDHPMAAAIEGTTGTGLYVIGGNSGGRPSARVYRLAPDAREWREVAPLPRGRSAGAAVTAVDPQFGVTERIVVVGGASDRGLETETLVYDPAANAWSAKAAIPTARDHLAAAFMTGLVCAVGGRTLSMTRNLPAFECYDPKTDTWERREAAPTARGGVGAAVAQKQMFFIGGEQPSGTFREVEIYDQNTRRWSRGPDLPTARHGIGVVAFQDRIYVLTGGPTPGGSQTPVCEVLTLR